MLLIRRRLLSAAAAAKPSAGFDMFSRSRDVVGAETPPAPEFSDLKRKPTERVKKLVAEILDLTLIEAADLCDLCQEQLASRSGNSYSYPSSMFAAQMGAPQMMMGGFPPTNFQQPPQTVAPVESPPAAPAEPPKAEAKLAPEKAAKPSIVSIKLVAFDASKKVQTVKEVRAITSLGLKEAKEAVEASPKVIKKGVAYEEALLLKQKLEEVGATVELE